PSLHPFPTRRSSDLVELRHRGTDPEGGERGDAVLGDAAGDDPAVMGELGVEVEGDAVIAHPAAQAHADRGDLVLAAAGPGDPDRSEEHTSELQSPDH